MEELWSERKWGGRDEVRRCLLGCRDDQNVLRPWIGLWSLHWGWTAGRQVDVLLLPWQHTAMKQGNLQTPAKSLFPLCSEYSLLSLTLSPLSLFLPPPLSFSTPPSLPPSQSLFLSSISSFYSLPPSLWTKNPTTGTLLMSRVAIATEASQQLWLCREGEVRGKGNYGSLM